MSYNEWLANYDILTEWCYETFDIDTEIWIRQYPIGGGDKYKEFTNNQLLQIRNHLHRRYETLFNKLLKEAEKWIVKN
jgi:hypothetical protein